MGGYDQGHWVRAFSINRFEHILVVNLSTLLFFF